MMASRIVSAIAFCLAGVLAWMWIDPATTSLRSQAWVSPPALVPDLSAPDAATQWMQSPASGASAYFAILDRPLFAADRRPAPVATDVAAAAPAPDALDQVHLYGLFLGQGASGAMLRVDGKTRRVMLSELVGEWTLSEIRPREAVFTRGPDTRVVPLVPYKVGDTPPPRANSNLPMAAPKATPTTDNSAEAENARREAAKRENIRKRNALRTSAGLPPIND
jgi:hypothetical protein